MQIDGHHTGTYIAARSAGFTHAEADIIAYAAQYVDDAVNEGAIYFAGTPFMYARIASAHSMIDQTNLFEVKNHLAWLPFHFLPGNGPLPAGHSVHDNQIQLMACLPDSQIARDMLQSVMKDRDTPRALHRLGIAMHVYADTFAHQGFIGAQSPGNRVTNCTSGDDELDKRIRKVSEGEFLASIIQKTKAFFQFVATAFRIAFKERKSVFRYYQNFRNKLPLGHAAADTFPDQPFLKWSYINWKGKTVPRDNPTTFMHAFQMMTKAMQAWRAGDASVDLDKYPGMPAKDAAVLESLIKDTTDPRGEERHAVWIKAIAAGRFSFGPESLAYQDKGNGSWKEKALGTNKRKDSGYELYQYSPAFLQSHWKLFHDALQAHRIDVVHEILPKYGICAA